MKTETFLRRLRELTEHGEAEWQVIEGDITSTAEDLCPIHEVHLARFGCLRGDVFQEAHALRLSEEAARAIVYASDNKPGHDPAIRAQLLQACGLL